MLYPAPPPPLAPPHKGEGKVPFLATNLDLNPLIDALARATDEGRTTLLWWRDDDAVAHTPALDRLLALAARTGWPVALAAIPARAEPSLAARVAEEAGVDLLVHGLAHANHAPADAKKAEFGPHRPLAALQTDAADALALAKTRLGPRLLPVLVPPWNRIAPALPEPCRLSGIAASRRPAPCPRCPDSCRPTPRSIRSPGAPGRAGRSGRVIARAARAVAEGGPVGLLTHHLVQDAATWDFCERVLDGLAAHAAKDRVFGISRAAALFAPTASPVSQPGPIFRGDPGTPPPRDDSTASG